MNDLAWEIWSCSPPNYDLPRVDAWFELHSLDRKMGTQSNAPYFDKLRQHARVYVQALDKRLPNAIAYDKDPMVAKYGRYFFTSSLAWMMALAIEQKPEKIGLWGVDMSATEEYGYQRAGMHYFIQKAQDAGIDVFAPKESDILQPIPLYGFKEASRMYWKQKARKHELMGRVNECAQTIENKKREELILRGALDDIEYVNNTWLQDG